LQPRPQRRHLPAVVQERERERDDLANPLPDRRRVRFTMAAARLQRVPLRSRPTRGAAAKHAAC